MKMYVKKEKGITLVALVITIIVLLILAGIAIAAISGENGILTRASEAKQKTGREEIIEKAKLEILEYEAENEGKITDEEAKAIIAKYDKDYDENIKFQFQINENNEEYFTTKEGYEILVSEIWKVKKKITFTIAGIEFIANEGETWYEWIKNDENFQKCYSLRDLEIMNDFYVLIASMESTGQDEEGRLIGQITCQVPGGWASIGRGEW